MPPARNPFGNDDEPDPPDWFWPGRSSWLRYVGWYIRNPLHNFTAYIVGVKGRQFTFIPSRPNTVDSAFADAGGWLFGALLQGRSVPVVALRVL